MASIEQPATIVVTDSATLLDDRAAGSVTVCGSHGGTVAALFAAAVGVKGALFNDAAVGKEEAGIAGLGELDSLGIAAAAVDYRSARIGDGEDCHRSGVVSFANGRARDAGVRAGMAAATAARLIAAWPAPAEALGPRPPSPAERDPAILRDGWPRVLAVDSVSRVDWSMAGSIVLGGSHGGIVNNRAIKAPVRAAFFNDAGTGKDGAGISRLAALDVCGIPGATVSALSARIGDGRDTYESGIVSHANVSASALGLRPGQPAVEAVALLCAAVQAAARDSS